MCNNVLNNDIIAATRYGRAYCMIVVSYREGVYEGKLAIEGKKNRGGMKGVQDRVMDV